MTVVTLLVIAAALVLHGPVHPGAALRVGPILVCAPHALARAVTARRAGWFRGTGEKR